MSGTEYSCLVQNIHVWYIIFMSDIEYSSCLVLNTRVLYRILVSGTEYSGLVQNIHVWYIILMSDIEYSSCLVQTE